jgi:hypothetical protein
VLATLRETGCIPGTDLAIVSLGGSPWLEACEALLRLIDHDAPVQGPVTESATYHRRSSVNPRL